MEPAPTAEPDSADWRPQPDATRLLDSESDLISTSPEGKTDALTAVSLPLAFPRNWPSVFKESVALKTLVNKKNLNGVRCRAVELTTDAMEAARSAATKAKVELQKLVRLTTAGLNFLYLEPKGSRVWAHPAGGAPAPASLAQRRAALRIRQDCRE